MVNRMHSPVFNDEMMSHASLVFELCDIKGLTDEKAD